MEFLFESCVDHVTNDESYMNIKYFAGKPKRPASEEEKKLRKKANLSFFLFLDQFDLFGCLVVVDGMFSVQMMTVYKPGMNESPVDVKIRMSKIWTFLLSFFSVLYYGLKQKQKFVVLSFFLFISW